MSYRDKQVYKEVMGEESGFVRFVDSIMRYKYARRVIYILGGAAPFAGWVINEVYHHKINGGVMFSKPHDFAQMAMSLLIGGGLAWALNQDGKTKSRLINALAMTKEELELERIAIVEEREMFQLISSASPLGVLYRDQDGNYQMANDVAKRIFEIDSHEDLRGKNIADLLSPDFINVAREGDAHALGVHGPVEDVVPIHGVNYRVTRVPRYSNEDPTRFLGMIVYLRNEQDLYVDKLSGLLNKWAMDIELARTFAQTRRKNQLHPGSTVSALMYIDYDKFKYINDNFGHLQGDELIRAIGKMFAAHVRETDFKGRLGGDEFGVIIPDIGSAENALIAAQHYIDAMRDEEVPGITKDIRSITGLSVGICLFDGSEASVEKLVQFADDALYQSKSKRDNQMELGTYRQGNITIHSSERIRTQAVDNSSVG